LLILVTSQPQGQGSGSRVQNHGRLLHDVLRGLEKATEFFREDFSSINVDGLFGIRLAQGTILQSLDWCMSDVSVRCPSELLQRLQALNTTIGHMADKALPYIKAQDPEYYTSFYKTIDSPYLIQEAGSQSLGDAVAPPGLAMEYNEDSGDRCLANIMGTWSKDGRIADVCTVGEDCLEMMTRPNQASYSITHQLLYFIMAEKNGCLKVLDAALARRQLGSVKEFERQLCGHIYSEVRREVKDGAVAQLKQDLFLEQNVLCGVIGFAEFFPPSWIRLVLSWQTSRGCFSMQGPLVAIQPAATAQVEHTLDKQRQLLRLMEEEAKRIDESVWTRRKLLRERVMEDDCLAHKSGLGIALLGVYQRHLLESLST